MEINLDDLTIGQLKTIANLAQGLVPAAPAMFDITGKYVIVRANLSGVHAGTVQAVDKNQDGTLNVSLSNARRLWRWWAKDGVGLGGVAVSGLANRSEVRIGVTTPMVMVLQVFEVCECTNKGRTSIEEIEAK